MLAGAEYIHASIYHEEYDADTLNDQRITQGAKALQTLDDK